MFGRWRRSSRLKSRDAGVRMRALESLQESEIAALQDDLLRLARDDEDDQVRVRALGLVADENEVVRLVDDERIGGAAADLLATRCLEDKRPPVANNAAILTACMRLASDEHVPFLLSVTYDVEALVDLALRSRNETRKLVLEHPALATERALAILEKTARGRDKSCYRYAKNRLETLRQTTARCQTLYDRIVEVDMSINKELKQHPNTADSVRAHRGKLAALASTRIDLCAALEQANSDLLAAGGQRGEYSAGDDPLAGVDLYIPDPANDPFKSLVKKLNDLAADMRSGVAVPEARNTRDSIASEWLTNADRFPPTADQHATFEEVSALFSAYEAAWIRAETLNWDDPPPTDPKDLKTWCQTWRKRLSKLDWPAGHTVPGFIEHQQQQLSNSLAGLKDTESARASKLELLHELARAVEAELADGQTKSATRDLKKIRDIASELAAGVALDSETENLINTLSTRLAQLTDWRKYATVPKRQVLISSMRELAENPLPPAEQAEQLKTLRREWQDLGRPAGSEEFALQREFDSLAEEAFKTCEAHYEVQKQLRADNLQARIDICEQIERYLAATDFEQADLKAAREILNAARQAWQTHHPCDRRALQPVEARFESLQKQLHDELKKRWGKNADARRELITRARSALDQDLESQIATIKTLQEEWRNCGALPRGQDQRLWKEFRQVCDQAFASRDAHFDEQRAEQTRLSQLLETAVSELVTASESECSLQEARRLNDAIDHAAQDSRMTAHQRKRRDDANRAIQQRQEETLRGQRLAQLEQWRQWDMSVSESEAAGTKFDSPDPVFDARASGAATPADWKRLALTAEIAADMPSPETDQSERMALQVEFMNTGRRTFSDKDLEQLLKDWCAAGPKDDIAAQLRDRFFAALRSNLNRGKKAPL